MCVDPGLPALLQEILVKVVDRQFGAVLIDQPEAAVLPVVRAEFIAVELPVEDEGAAPFEAPLNHFRGIFFLDLRILTHSCL
jgi:hypothetical protein